MTLKYINDLSRHIINNDFDSKNSLKYFVKSLIFSILISIKSKS